MVNMLWIGCQLDGTHGIQCLRGDYSHLFWNDLPGIYPYHHSVCDFAQSFATVDVNLQFLRSLNSFVPSRTLRT